MPSVLSEICFDCADPDGVAAFWSEVLGWPMVSDPEGYCWLSATGKPDTPPLVVFVAVPEPKTVKNRVHLDLAPSGTDQATELERLLALGARRVDIGQGEQPWVVLADPEGNEFCLLGPRK